MKRTYYSVLHVLHNDTPETIHEAYKRVRKSHEPGLLAHDPAIIAEAKLAKEAFDTLVDPARKAAYDAEMSLSTTAYTTAIEVKRVTFWDPTRVIVWSAVLILVIIAVFFRPEKPINLQAATPAAQAPKPAEGQPPADTPAQKSGSNETPAAADSGPPRTY